MALLDGSARQPALALPKKQLTNGSYREPKPDIVLLSDSARPLHHRAVEPSWPSDSERHLPFLRTPFASG